MKSLKSMKGIKAAFFLCLIIVFFNNDSFAQKTDQGTIVDKIVAKVDNYIVLKSELERAYYELLSRGESNITRCNVLERLVINKLMVAKAEIDSVYVEEEIVDRQLDMKINGIVSQVGGDAKKIEEYYGKTIEEFREELRDQVKEQLIVEKMQSIITEEITVTPSEVKKFFKGIPQDSLPYISTEVTIGQIVKKPEVSKEEKSEIIAHLNKIRSMALEGEDFQQLAMKYSEGPTGPRGGNLGEVERGQMVSEFEAAALKLKAGEISTPVQTEFGFHIIQMVERRGNIYNARHILVKPKFKESDFEKAGHFLDSIRTLVITDSIKFDKAAKEFSDDDFTASNGGFLRDMSGANRVSVSDLDPGLFFTMDTMKIGSITPPMKFKLDDGNEAMRIIYYKSKLPPHQANLNDDYQKIQAATLNSKKSQQMGDWFNEAKEEVFIQIDPEYNQCQLFQ